MTDRTVEHAICLGCGCACDDITVVVHAGRIAETKQACALGVQWFGDGSLPARVMAREGASGGDVVSTLAAAASMLRAADRALVFLAADVSCETQRAAIAVADVLGAAVDSITTSTAGAGVLAAQRRGRSSATLGEIRNRADVVLFWGSDPATRYPRYASRYAPEPIGLYVPDGRRGRTVLAVDIGESRGPADADARCSFAPEEEITALGVIRAALRGMGARSPGAGSDDSVAGRAAALADRLRRASYLAIVADGEPAPGRDPRRGEALIALTEALNGPTRCVLSTLRAGGNRSGADAVLTAQTGYPMAVDFARGSPQYRPEDDAIALLARREIDTVLVVGSPASVPDAIQSVLAHVTCIAIGPRASESPFRTACAIDTGVAGVHERGVAFRLDDLPLALRPALEPAAVAGFRERYGPGTPQVAAATVTALLGTGGGSSAMSADAARARQTSPECGVMEALAAAGLPQDSYTLLRALGAVLSQRPRVAASAAGPAA